MKPKSAFFQKLRCWYILIGLWLTFPVFCVVLFSSLYAMDYGDHWDSHTTATVISCEDKTPDSRGEGFPSLSFETVAVYEVDGKQYKIKEFGGTRYKVGSTVGISYRSDDPADSYWAEDPPAQNRLMKRFHTASGVVLILTGTGCVMGIMEHRGKAKNLSKKNNVQDDKVGGDN